MINNILSSIYFFCTEFMVDLAYVAGFTYRDANAVILFGLIPAVLLADLIIFSFLICRVLFKITRREHRYNMH